MTMEYHLIQMKPTKTYLSLVDPNKKSRFVCFKDRRTANVFVDYVTHFRSKHGHWPNMDMSNRFATIRSKPGIKKRSPEELPTCLSLLYKLLIKTIVLSTFFAAINYK